MKRKRQPGYASLHEWMDATGTNSKRLAARIGIKEPHMSNILRKSRRCSLVVALKLHDITGVPVQNIVEWPPQYEETV